MSDARLDLLFVSLFPPSPATFGAQRRIEGLQSALGRRHRVTGVSLISPEYDAAAAERAMRAYCAHVELVPTRPASGLERRLVQLRSLVSSHSFERLNFTVPALATALDRLLRERAYDAVTIEAPFLSHYRFRQAPPGAPAPRLLIDEHNIEHDLARQSGEAAREPLRRLHYSVNWRKMMREEVAAWRHADGVIFTSATDADRARELHPGLRAEVVPNAVDVEHFRPNPDLPRPDGRTVVFFGTLAYFPNQDGMLWFLREIWPLLERSHPQARLKVIGPNPTADVLARRGPRIEVTGLVDDLRPHLAEAAVAIVPLRVGGGTRLKILEAMAMGKAVVSTTLGAEGIAHRPGENILLADSPADFAAAVGRVLDDPSLAARLGAAGRDLVASTYSWDAAGATLETFLHRLRDGGRPASG
jgi:glycosyltransferase involved in cell wall biosynthesis